jgi:hypothetical protein
MKNHKKAILGVVLAILVIGPLVLAPPKPVEAFSPGVVIVNTAKTIWEKITIVYTNIKEQLVSQVLRNTAQMYLNNLAYEVASSIADGATGGKALFRTDSIKDALRKSEEAAIGEFITELSELGFKDLGLDLCDPSIEVKLSLSVGLIDSQAPPPPTCNWREVQKKWKEFESQVLRTGKWTDFIKVSLDTRQSPAQWNDFWTQFDISNSDLGAAVRISDALEERKRLAKEASKEQIAECQGFHDKATAITQEVKTHCQDIAEVNNIKWDLITVEAQQKDAPAQNLKAAIGDILKEAGSLFMNTLSSKLLKFAVDEGMRQISSWYAEDLRGDLLDKLRGGADLRRAPRQADVFRDLKTINFQEVESYNLLANYSVCPEQADFRHPDNCVISVEFLQTLLQKVTLAEAIEDGLLNGELPIFNIDDQRGDPDQCYQDGFCYHNLIKLRKAGVIPVGWELAAERSPGGKPVTLQEAMNCFEDETCVYDTSPDYDNHNRYYHLIDPNWVLKSPPARCNALVYASTLEANGTNSRQQYCADVQTCLNEDDQGNCLDSHYGYCTRSENIWRFDADICEDGELYAGCLTFDHQTLGRASYLEQSLDYCTADEAGCKRYSQAQDVNNNWELGDIDADNDDLFLNNQATDCPSDKAGCHEYIVMAPSLGINLLPNGDFEYYTGNVDDTFDDDPIFGWNLDGAGVNQIVSEAYRGSTALLFSQNISATIETGLPLENRTFVFSFYAYAPAEADFSWRIFALGDDTVIDDTFDSEWGRYQLSHTFADGVTDSSLGISIAGGGQLIIDALQVEEISDRAKSGTSTNYSPYGDGGRILMNDNRSMCIAEEVGCQGYLSDNGDPMIPAIISADDICPSECVGYASFAQGLNIFDIIEDNTEIEYHNFIPDTAISCPAIAIGCEEFTNLDEVADGGEGKEYYTYLRQCVPEDAPDVATYFTWEGADVAGYQLKTWTFLKSDVDNAPCTSVDLGDNTCADSDDVLAIARCGTETPLDPLDDPIFDPNCREFFDVDGQPHFRFQDRTIFASNDCHPYRRAVTGQEYKAIPSLSHSCQAQYDGCRSYTGNAANNLRRLFIDNFEDGIYDPWTGPDLDLSNQSTANNGHSLKVGTGTTISRPLINLQDNHAYQLSWWMKNTGNLDDVVVTLSDGLGIHNIGSTSLINFGDWRRYEVTSADLIDLDLDSDISLNMQFVGNGDVFLDNIILKELIDNLSFVKNSWNTPASCDDPFSGAYLGCQAYTDTNNASYNLKSFDSLCREEAIGCRAVIDTHNSTSPFVETFNAGDYSQLTVSADDIKYLVPDAQYYCPEVYKGCSALGLPQVDQANDIIEGFDTVYKINNPDTYNRTLCRADALYCEAYDSSKGNYYFKDPGTRTCVYKKDININFGGPFSGLFTGWFKTESLEADATPAGCSDTNGTYELGDLELSDWAVECPPDKNLCTEYRDPVDPESCDVTIPGSCKSYYYYNNDNIDQSSCNGQVDRNNGCILLYDANDWNASHSEVNVEYDAAATYAENISINAPVNPVSGDTANLLVKVRKDRQCAEWLACKSSSTAFDPKTSSYKIICDALDSCTKYSSENDITQCDTWGTYTTTTPLTIAEYQLRATGDSDHLQWSDKEYTSYSVPDLLPMKDLLVYDFAREDEPADPRLVYESTVTCDPDDPEEELRPCTVSADFDGDGFNSNHPGICKDRTCWLNPTLDDQIISLGVRGYSAQDAPFAYNIAENRDTGGQAYSQANLCEDGDNECEARYKKATYGLGGFVKYFGGDPDHGVCISVSGNPPPDQVEGSSCDSHVDCGGFDNGGRCQAFTKVETFLNWPGICLENDFSTPILIDDPDGSSELALKYYCNQWYPVDQIQGAQSMYNNFTEAGFYTDSGINLKMCAVGEEYRTPEDRLYCEKHDGQGNCIKLLLVPAGSEVRIDQVEDNEILLQTYFITDADFQLYRSGTEVAGTGRILNQDIITINNPENISGGDNDEIDAHSQTPTNLGDINDNKFQLMDTFGLVPPTDFQLDDPVVFELDDLTDLYDAAVIEVFFYDSEAAQDGEFSKHANIQVSEIPADPDKEYYSGGSQCKACTGDEQPSYCTDDYHQIRYKCWKTSSLCGIHPKWRDKNRYCNPLQFNYYVKSDSTIGVTARFLSQPAAENSCTFDCQGPDYGLSCLENQTYHDDYYTDIDTADPDCASDPECAYKDCVADAMSAVNPDDLHMCHDYYGSFSWIEIDNGWSTEWEVSAINGCLSEVLEITALEGHNETTFKAGVSADFAHILLGHRNPNPPHNIFFEGCLPSNNTIQCLGLGSYIEEITEDNPCSGEECYQQCQTITEIDAEGSDEKSWVRTDVWWRAEEHSSPTSYHGGWPGNTWEAYYYATGIQSYTNNEDIYFRTVCDTGDCDVVTNDINTYFGGVDSGFAQPVVTQAPLYADQNQASIFFGNDWTEAESNMSWLLARFYNHNWIAADTEYNEIGVYGSSYTGANVNPDAGPDYAPYMYQVCDGDLCGPFPFAEGFTVNDELSGNIVGQGSLFVAAKFYYHAHPDHMPLTDVSIAWDDGQFGGGTGKYKNNLPTDYCDRYMTAPRGSGQMGFGGLDRACHVGDKIFYNTYTYDDTGVHDCDGSGGSPEVANASCYQPTVSVVDNWHESAIVDYNGWVIIYNQ